MAIRTHRQNRALTHGLPTGGPSISVYRQGSGGLTMTGVTNNRASSAAAGGGGGAGGSGRAGGSGGSGVQDAGSGGSASAGSTGNTGGTGSAGLLLRVWNGGSTTS